MNSWVLQLVLTNKIDWLILEQLTTSQNSLNNLDISQEYIGGGEVKIGNGIGLSISSIGSSNFSSPRATFTLKEILHVLDITKNLLSVHKFTLHNGVSIEFFHYHVHIKDQQTGWCFSKAHLMKANMKSHWRNLSDVLNLQPI